MELVSLVVVASIKLAAILSAGFFGLRMFKAMLLPVTPSSLRREAVTSIMSQASFTALSTHQQAAVLRASFESIPTHDRWTPLVRSLGITPPRRCIK